MSKRLILILEAILLVLGCAFILVCPFSKVFVKALLLPSFFILLALIFLPRSGTPLKLAAPRSSLNWLLLIFLLTASLSTVLSLNPYHSQKILFQRYFYYLFSFFLAFYLTRNSDRNLKIFVFCLLFMGIFIGIGGIRDYLLDRPYRLYSVFGKGLFLSAFLLFFLPLSFCVALGTRDRLLKIIAFCCLLLLLPVLIWNGSRLIWIAVSLTLIVFVSFNFNKLNILILVAVALTGGALLWGTEKQRLDVFSNFSGSSTVVDRENLAEQSLDIFRKRPVLGAGPGMFELLYVPHSKLKFAHLHAHNTYLEVAAEMGIAGLAVFIAIFSLMFWRAGKAWRKMEPNSRALFSGLLSVIFAFLAASLGGSLILVGSQDAVLFWFILGMITGMSDACLDAGLPVGAARLGGEK